MCGGMQIYVSKDGQRYCLYTSDQLREYVQQGNFTTTDHACFDGQNWVTIAEVPGFAVGGDSVTTAQYSQGWQEQAAPEDASHVLVALPGGIQISPVHLNPFQGRSQGTGRFSLNANSRRRKRFRLRCSRKL